MLYKHDNLVLNQNNSSRSVLYKNGRILFMGNGYIAILRFIEESGDNPDVRALFTKQLEQRETCRLKEKEMPLPEAEK